MTNSSDKPDTHPSPEKVYEDLEQVENADTARSADYHEEALEVLADSDVDADKRQAIAERLEQVDNHNTIKNVDPEDSY
jgi:hypothetical protein